MLISRHPKTADDFVKVENVPNTEVKNPEAEKKKTKENEGCIVS